MGPLAWACKRSSVPLLLVDVLTVCLLASFWSSCCTSCCNVPQSTGYFQGPNPTPRSALAWKDGAATLKSSWARRLQVLIPVLAMSSYMPSLFSYVFILTNYVSSSSLSRQEWTPAAPSMPTSRMTPGLSPAVIYICSHLLVLKNHLTAASAIKGHSLATFRLFNLVYVCMLVSVSTIKVLEHLKHRTF